MPKKLMLSITQAASRYGLSAAHMRLLVRRGYLSGSKFGRDWLLVETDESMREKLARRPTVGAPRKAQETTMEPKTQKQYDRETDELIRDAKMALEAQQVDEQIAAIEARADEPEGDESESD